MNLTPSLVELTNSAWQAYRSGQRQVAFARCQQALTSEHNNPQALHLYALLHAELGEFGIAERCLSSSLALYPAPAIWNDFAVVYSMQGRTDEAIAALRNALAMHSDNKAYYYAHLASLQARTGKLDDAIESCRASIALRDDPRVLNNLGELLLAKNDLGGAEAVLRHAISLDSTFDLPYQNLGVTLFNSGNHDQALASMDQALQRSPASLLFRSNRIMMMTYHPSMTERQLYDEARRYASFAEKTATRFSEWPGTLSNDKPLRVGFVSGRLCQSPVAHFLEGLLRQLAEWEDVEVVLYSNTPVHDQVSGKLQALCDLWQVVTPLGDRAMAELVRQDRIDVLIDLAGHSKFNRLPVFAWKPAPIQASWMEFSATTGLAEMDYVICDRWSIVPDGVSCFIEKPWPLPDGRLCFTAPSFDLLPNELPCLSSGFITFGSFNNFAKLNQAVFEAWAEILKQVPDSRLLMSTTQFGDAAIRHRVADAFRQLGIGTDRLEICPPLPREQFMSQYHLVDIALDSFPYQGVTTTVEALWMGVPVMMYAGETFISRQSVNVHAQLGLDEWISSSRDDYISKAVSHASDTGTLRSLRRELRARLNASPVLDAGRFAADFRKMLYEMKARRRPH
jgi:predicted O-linked N-acetylglucosamine transferase (SPINDLY family)